MEYNLVEGRSYEGITGYSWTIGIKTHHTEYGPCGHRSRVVIAGYAIRLIFEVFFQELVDQRVSSPFFTFDLGKKVGVSDVWLICRIVEVFIEYFSQLGGEFLFSSHQSF